MPLQIPVKVAFAAPVVAFVLVAIVPTDALAGAAWGDATLKGDDVRIELDSTGRAEVIHTVSIHVAAKKFRAFTVEGMDERLQPPADEATVAGMDGPGWPASATDAKGQSVEAFIEPAKEPGRLRVRLGADGVGRGEYTVRLRYRVDFAQHAFVRDGAFVRFAWSAPRWPEGYDGARIVFVVPAAPGEPKVKIADGAGEGEHEADGVALVAVRRGAAHDELEITRPHVPPHDDLRWIVRVDPKAFPTLPVAALDAATHDTAASPVARTLRGRQALALACATSFVALIGLILRRDRDADRARGADPFRPLLPLPPLARALSYGAASAGAIAATWSGQPLVGGALALAAIALGTLRAPVPATPSRAKGRWLAVPEAGIPRAAPRGNGPLDPGGILGKVIAGVVMIGAATALAILARAHARSAVALAIDLAVLAPLFLTGTSRQLAPDLVGDAHRVLGPIARALDLPTARVRFVVRLAQEEARRIDEVRIRVEPLAEAGPGAATGLCTIEIGCGLVHGAGGTSLVPEILVRFSGANHASRGDVAARLAAESGTAPSPGRTEDELVVAIRPASNDPQLIRRWVMRALGGVEDRREGGAAPNALRERTRLTPASPLGS